MDASLSWFPEELLPAALHEAQVANRPSLRLDCLVWAALNRASMPEGRISVVPPKVCVNREGGRLWYHRLTSDDHFSESLEKASRAVRRGWSLASNHVGGGVYEGVVSNCIDDSIPKFRRLGLTPANAVLAAALFAEMEMMGLRK